MAFGTSNYHHWSGIGQLDGVRDELKVVSEFFVGDLGFEPAVLSEKGDETIAVGGLNLQS